MIFLSTSPKQTLVFGKKIGGRLHTGMVVCLYGTLGAGKTLLVKGIARGLGVDEEEVSSPSFSLMNQYNGKLSTVNHIDLYRVDDPVSEMEEIGYRELFYGEDITLIEWADKIKELLPKKRLDITLTSTGDRKRKLAVTGWGDRFEKMIIRNCW